MKNKLKDILMFIGSITSLLFMLIYPGYSYIILFSFWFYIFLLVLLNIIIKEGYV